MGSLLLALTAMVVAASPGVASEVKMFRANRLDAFLGGDLEGVSIDPRGTLRLAQKVERLAGIEEPFVFSATKAGDGWVVGTGNDGKVLEVDAQGQVTELFRADEPEIYAVLAGRDGAVYAGSSPNGKVYRYRDGERQEIFSPEQKYIWALVQDQQGRLVVATGTEGKLFRGDSSDGSFETLYDSKDQHLRALLALDDGDLVVGTAGEGLVLRVSPDGRARTLYDATQPEVTSLAIGDDGSIFAAVLASEASFVDLAASQKTTASASAKDSESSDEDKATVTVETGAISAGSRPASFKGARSTIIRITPSGSTETIGRFEKETVFSLLVQERLWAGTGMEGKLYSFRADQMVLEKDLEELQIVALSKGEHGPVIVTTNSGALYRVAGGVETEGSYTSDTLDAGSAARFGTLHWQGDEPAGSRVRFQARAGMSSEPDATWSDWSAPATGREIPLGNLEGRYVQWRALLERSDSAEGKKRDKGQRDGNSSVSAGPAVVAVDLSYLQDNQRPEIKSFEVLDPGKIIVPSNFNPSNQAFEPAAPNRDGIFTTIGKPASETSRRKQLWKQGYQTLEWEAEDPNGDPLEFSLFFQRLDGAGFDRAGSRDSSAAERSRGDSSSEDPSSGETERWLPIKDELEESYYSFDSTVLPDGLYRFRLVASDRRGNLPDTTKSSEKLSGVVPIDHSGPRLLGVTVSAESLVARVDDPWSPLREAVYSVDAAEWRPVAAADGLIDGRSEELRMVAPKGASLILLRVTDASLNVTTYDLSEYLASDPSASAKAGGR